MPNTFLEINLFIRVVLVHFIFILFRNLVPKTMKTIYYLFSLLFIQYNTLKRKPIILSQSFLCVNLILILSHLYQLPTRQNRSPHASMAPMDQLTQFPFHLLFHKLPRASSSLAQSAAHFNGSDSPKRPSARGIPFPREGSKVIWQ